MLRFLEERAPERAATPSRQNDEPFEQPARITAEQVFIIEKYTGFNRFRGRYRKCETTASVSANSARAQAKALA
jgi:hypothetical protein